MRALGTLPKLKIILGKYQERTVTCRARDCMRRLEYQVPEEKKTDVNVAVNLLEDAFRGLTDSMVIVSGDSDLEPAVEWVRRNYPQIKITVYIPVLEDEREERRNLLKQSRKGGRVERGVILPWLKSALPDEMTLQLPLMPGVFSSRIRSALTDGSCLS
jgi:hypothetical protein